MRQTVFWFNFENNQLTLAVAPGLASINKWIDYPQSCMIKYAISVIFQNQFSLYFQLPCKLFGLNTLKKLDKHLSVLNSYNYRLRKTVPDGAFVAVTSHSFTLADKDTLYSLYFVIKVVLLGNNDFLKAWYGLGHLLLEYKKNLSFIARFQFKLQNHLHHLVSRG